MSGICSAHVHHEPGCIQCEAVPSKTESLCACCGMPCTPNEYHPYAACLMFQQCHNSTMVRANLHAVLLRGRDSAAETPVAQGCPIHGTCHICRGLAALGDPRIGVQIGPDIRGATFLRPVAPDAAQGPNPAAMSWWCTKHGQIPYQDCAQCRSEQVKSTCELGIEGHRGCDCKNPPACPKCKTLLAFAGDTCWACSKEERL